LSHSIEERAVPDIISTDHPLTRAQQVVLAALLDTLVPASDDGAMPSAADVGFDAYLLAQAEDFVPLLILALQRFESSFVDLPLADRCERVRELSASDPHLFQALLTRVYDCYYQNERVRVEIGVVTGAPFPQGNQVTQGDLSLLDPVIEQRERHIYRKP
jgi:hypothetical protein